MTERVVVVGGGVAGLATAYRLLTSAGGAAPPEVTVMEAGDQPGGKVTSVQVGGLSIPAGPESFVSRKPWAAELCRDLGLGDDLIAPDASGAFLWTERGLVRYPPDAPFGIPGDLAEVFRWPGVSRSGRRRAAQDLVRRARRERTDESLGSLLRRRLGDEATDAAVAPLLGGLFAGDVDRLSVQATFPELAEWEREQGSLIRGAQAVRRMLRDMGPAAGGPMFLGLSGGLERLVEGLVESVGAGRILTRTPATRVHRRPDGFAVEAKRRLAPADAVVLATPAFVAADLVSEVAPNAVASLRGIPYVSTAVVLSVYPPGTADSLPEATGFVVPVGKAPMTAATFLSRKWPQPSFDDRAVVRCFVGGAGAEDVLDAADEDIVEAVSRHLAAVVELPPAPEVARVVRWGRAMPQYEVGHLDAVAEIEGALPPGIFVTGSAYRGVGLADSARQADDVAKRILGGEPADRGRELAWTD